MNFKKWPYWLKGGAISLPIAFLLFLVLFPFGTPSSSSSSYGGFDFPYWTIVIFSGLLIAIMQGGAQYGSINIFGLLFAPVFFGYLSEFFSVYSTAKLKIEIN